MTDSVTEENDKKTNSIVLLDSHSLRQQLSMHLYSVFLLYKNIGEQKEH
jgi:hypothetical protein